MTTMVRNETTRNLTRAELHAAKKAREAAMERYHDALVRARAEGWSNTQVAMAVGVSEAAIRLYWKRHQERE